jgi:hypothetical protein
MTEYAFDVKLWAVAHVCVNNLKEARAKLAEIGDCIEIGFESEGDDAKRLTIVEECK